MTDLIISSDIDGNFFGKQITEWVATVLENKLQRKVMSFQD